ncbi:MAG: DUF2283 domain-containing protein [Chloroflexi bacterium]|nr:DUF2283 domain-containing protein [Chloroflexota bacterium]
MKKPRAHYFPETDTMVIFLSDHPGIQAEEVAENVIFTHDDNHAVVAVEILNGARNLFRELLSTANPDIKNGYALRQQIVSEVVSKEEATHLSVAFAKKIEAKLRQYTKDESIVAELQHSGQRYSLKCADGKRFGTITLFQPKKMSTAIRTKASLVSEAGLPDELFDALKKNAYYGQEDAWEIEIPYRNGNWDVYATKLALLCLILAYRVRKKAAR